MRFLLFFFFVALAYYAISILFRLLRFWSRWRQMSAQMQGPEADELVRDPACQVYIPKGNAIRKRIKGKTLYFCSAECVRAYKREGGKAEQPKAKTPESREK